MSLRPHSWGIESDYTWPSPAAHNSRPAKADAPVRRQCFWTWLGSKWCWQGLNLLQRLVPAVLEEMRILLRWYYSQSRDFCDKSTGASKLAYCFLVLSTKSPLYSLHMSLAWGCGPLRPKEWKRPCLFLSLTARRNQPSGHGTVQLHG